MFKKEKGILHKTFVKAKEAVANGESDIARDLYDFMIYLAYRIIRSQQSEIILLNDMLSKKNYKYQSNLIS